MSYTKRNREEATTQGMVTTGKEVYINKQTFKPSLALQSNATHGAAVPDPNKRMRLKQQ